MSDSRKAVFLSYASQDAEAAKRIADALHAAGVEVWFDAEGGLEHGDEWDAKIRRQIKECVLFIPIISANTQARHEGYFRLEWDLASERARTIASGVPFILPVVIDDTKEPAALVPDRFRAVQWTRLPEGNVPPEVLQRFLKLWSHRTGMLRHEAARTNETDVGRGRRTAPDPEEAAFGDPALQRKRASRSWLVPAVASVAVITGAVLLWRPWRALAPSATNGPEVAAARAHPATVPGSVGEQLADQAYQLTRKVTVTRNDLDAADTLVRRAVDLAAESPRVWAVRAWVQAAYIERRLDLSAKRRQDAQAFAERARALNPDDADALNALAQVMLVQGAYAEAEKLLRHATEVAPDNPRSRLLLAQAVTGQNRKEEGRNLLLETVRLRPTDVLARYALAADYVPFFNANPSAADVAKASEQLDIALAQQPFEAGLEFKALLAASRYGDLATMRAALDGMEKLPLAERASDRAVWVAMLGGLLERKPERVLAAAALTARPYLEDNLVGLPKDMMVALAYQIAGKSNLAQQHWRAAEAAMRDHMREGPGDPTDVIRLGLILAASGRKGEAAREIAPVEATWREDMTESHARLLARYYGAAGDADSAAPYLERVLNKTYIMTDHMLLLDSWWDSLRGQPAFEAILARARERIAATVAPETPSAGISPTHSPDPKSVVVLPFANLSGDPAQEYFSDGLTEEILNALARERDLRVVPRTSAFSFKGRNVPLAEIAQALKVAQIVEGSVQRAGSHVRVRCTLTRVADGFAVALPAFDRELANGTDIFALEDEVARAVVEKLTRRTTTAAPVAVLTKNSDAYDAYLRGRDLMNQTSPSWPKAVEAFRRALELDPQFALAWANLGQLSASLYAYGFDGAALAASGRAIDEAVRLQPGLPEAHLARAYYLQATLAPPDAVEHELEVAEGMRPNDPAILEFRASVEFARGGEESGIKLMQRAVDLDPRNGANLNALGNELTSVGRYAEAEAAYRQAFQILGSSIPLTNRARIYFRWKGDRALAARTLDEAPERIRGDRYWTSRALLLYATGDQPGALAAAAHMKPRSEFFRIRAFFTARMREAMGDAAGAQRDYLAALPLAEQQRDEFPALPTPYAILGSIYAGLGRKTEALAAVQKAIEGEQPGAIGAATTGQAGLARKGIMAWTLVDLELDPLVALAQVEARFGMTDEALAIVQAAAAAGQWRRNYLLLSPDWAVLRKDPRFQAIVEKAPL